MATADLFDRVGDLLEEIGAEKKAADSSPTKRAMDDPGGHTGPSSHPSTKGDDGELSQPAPEGEQSADNSSAVKEQTPNTPDSMPELTPESAPTQDEVQLGQGVDAAKPTGEDPGTENDFDGTKEDPPEGSAKNQGGTSHPASGDIGEKYSSDALARLSDAALFKAAADMGNELAADMANGILETSAGIVGQGHSKQAMKTKRHCPDCSTDYEGDKCSCGYTMGKMGAANSAADAGYQAAAAVGDATDQEKMAGHVLSEVIKTAQHQAGLIAQYLIAEKQAMEEGDEDPLAGGAEGEAHGSEEGGGMPPEAGGGGGGDAELLAAMAGGAGGGMPPEGGGMPPEGGGMPPEGGGMPPEGGMGAPPDALGGMGEEEALQQLAMALMELGIDPSMLAAAGGGGGGMPPEAGGMPPEAGGMPPEAMGMEAPGPKLAAAVDNFRRSGRFRVSETKTAAERQVRDYMKGYITELCKRN